VLNQSPSGHTRSSRAASLKFLVQLIQLFQILNKRLLG